MIAGISESFCRDIRHPENKSATQAPEQPKISDVPPLESLKVSDAAPREQPEIDDTLLNFAIERH